jgi:hypothetical protein
MTGREAAARVDLVADVGRPRISASLGQGHDDPILSIRLTQAAYAHGLALALPEKVALTRLGSRSRRIR